MIIFGLKTKPKVLGGFKNVCPECGNQTIHSLTRITKWFTLYFIPVLPYSNKLLVTCHACGLRSELVGEAKDKVGELIHRKPIEVKKDDT